MKKDKEFIINYISSKHGEMGVLNMKGKDEEKVREKFYRKHENCYIISVGIKK